MKKRIDISNYKSSIAGILLAVFGEVLGYYVYASFTHGIINTIFGLISFFAIAVGTFLAVYPLILLIEKIRLRKTVKGSVLSKMINGLSMLIGILSFVLAWGMFYYFTGQYHKSQISKYGTVQKVVILSEIRGRNSRHDLCFQFNHDGKVWKGMLDAWKYRIGDTVDIIFSGRNPNEQEWYRKFLEENPINGH